MSTTSTKNQKMLEKVRALIAKAESTPYAEEAQAFRAKADQLMLDYAIEQWQVEDAQGGVNARPKPEVRHFDFAWWYNHPQSGALWSLFYRTADYCRCVVATRGHGKEHGDRPYSYREMPVIGLASDLDYMDMLFTHLMLQMSKNLTPEPDPSAEPGKNVYEMRMAGMDWKEITRRMWKIGQVKLLRGRMSEVQVYTDSGGYEPITLDTPFERLPESYWTGVKNNLANLNRAYVKEHGLPRNYVAPAVYQRSYADGFVTGVSGQFREREAMREQAPASGGPSVALVVRDIRQQAVDLYEELWPTPAPVKSKGRRSRALAKERAYSYEASQHGREAGRKADLANKPSERIGNRKQLDG
jgi:hypothetical protein